MWLFNYKKLAFTDVLCNCFNRNYFELKLVKKYSLKECFITIIDIDKFKKVNDSYGHLAGDNILRELVSFLKEDNDILDICRYGGDEFVLFHKNNIDFSKKQLEFFNKTEAKFSFGTNFKEKQMSVKEALSISDKKLYNNKTKSQ